MGQTQEEEFETVLSEIYICGSFTQTVVRVEQQTQSQHTNEVGA